MLRNDKLYMKLARAIDNNDVLFGTDHMTYKENNEFVVADIEDHVQYRCSNSILAAIMLAYIESEDVIADILGVERPCTSSLI